MLDNRLCSVRTADELDAEIRDIFSLDLAGRGNEIAGTLCVRYCDESVKSAVLISTLEARGVSIVWRKEF
jgi:hypothetical protein